MEAAVGVRRSPSAESRDLRARLLAGAQVVPFLALILLLVVLPLGLLASYSLRESSFLGVGSGPTFEQYKLVFENPNTVKVMLRTIGVAAAVGALVTALSCTIGYALTFRLRARTGLIVLGVIVAAGIASLLVRVFAWGSILGTNGIINGGLEAIGVISEPLGFLFFGYFSIILTMTYLYLPIGALIVYSSMQGIDRHDLEASRDLGAGRWRTLFKVVVPQAKTGLGAAFVLSAIFASADFVTPRLVGGPRGLTVGALVQDLALTGGDLPGAAALAISFLGLFVAVFGVALLLLFALRRLLRRAGPTLDRAAAAMAGRFRSPLSRRTLSVPATGALLVYLVVPTALVIVFSLNAAPSTGLPITGLTTDWYGEITSRAGFSESLRGSLIVTSIGVVGATLVAVPFAFAMARARGAWNGLLWIAVFLPFVIPGVLLGSALLVSSRETGLALGLSATAIVHVMLLVSEITLIVYARLSGIDSHLVEAARDLGASPSRALRSVTLPLLLPAIVGAALFAAAYSLDEIFVTAFTLGPENTLPVWLFGQARIGFTPGINAVGVMLLFGTLLAFTLAVLIGRRSVLSTGGEAQ